MYSIQVRRAAAVYPHSSYHSPFLSPSLCWPSVSVTHLFSRQSQHSHLVIQQLLGHLDANSKNSARVRAGIVEVLLEAAAIAASGSVGALHVCTHVDIALKDKQKWFHLWSSCVFRSNGAGGVQHSAEAASPQRRLRADRLVRRQHQHRHQDYQSSRGEAAAGSRHQDHWWVWGIHSFWMSSFSLGHMFYHVSVPFSPRFLCQHLTHLPEIRGHALHHGQDSRPWSKSDSTLYWIWVRDLLKPTTST